MGVHVEGVINEMDKAVHPQKYSYDSCDRGCSSQFRSPV